MKKMLLCLLFFPISTFAQTYTYSTLASFTAGGPSNPSSLIIDASGNLYGTSLSGGKYGFGTVYKVTPKGVLTVLHSLNNTGTDVYSPSSLVRDSRQGNLYGVGATTSGGAVFKMKAGAKGTYTFSTVYRNTIFKPVGVTLDSTGDLYGTGVCPDGYTCMFEIPASGNFTDLDDVNVPGVELATSNLVVDTDGSLYAGFDWDDISGPGIVLQYPSQSTFDTSYTGPDSLRQDSSGNIFGSTPTYSDVGDYGLVFELTTAGVISTLYNFCSQPNCADGNSPGNLTLDSSRNIFGTDSAGVFKLTATGVFSLIYSGTVGAGLVMDKSGNLYGTTQNGGSKGLGSVYKLTKH